MKKFVPDFKAEVKWAEGVRKAIRWHEKKPERCVVDKEADKMFDKIIHEYGKAWPGASTLVISNQCSVISKKIHD